MRIFIYILTFIIFFFGCKPNSSIEVFGTHELNKANRKLLEVAMEDGFPPPIASRVYVYPHIASYLALSPFYKDSLTDLSKVLKGFENFSPGDTSFVEPTFASLLCFYQVAKKVVFSEHYMVSALDSLVLNAKKRGYSMEVIQKTQRYSEHLSEQIIKWLQKDNYVQTRTMDRFTTTKLPGKWVETPPDYQQGLEPHWMRIRTLVIDSASIFPIQPAPSYSIKKNSPFYTMVEKTYNQSKNLTADMVETAWFWDDNPNTSDHTGHSTAIIHKISPPGHWLNIIHQISDLHNYSFVKTAKLYTLTSIVMFDGIISTWHSKYTTDLVRPITYIQQNIDKEWKPLIQTPPFPEYTSGHSVISATAATMLTHELGDNFAFNDNTSELYGARKRSFNSFQDAAWEVSLSRFYGGIHYYNGIEEGNRQGKWISNYIISKLR